LFMYANAGATVCQNGELVRGGVSADPG
jgi:hypothetical protein